MRSLRIILVLTGKQLRVLSRMPGILLVIFVPGIVMYSVFTKIFEGPAARPFKVAVVDDDDSAESHKLIEALERGHVSVIRTSNGGPLTEEIVRREIRTKGKYRAALVIPEGFSKAPNVLSGAAHRGVRLIYDETQPMEADAILGMIQMAAGRRLFEQFRALAPTSAGDADGTDPRPSVLIKVEKQGVSIERMNIASKHTFLAGIVPMFLLFGAAGAARGLLEEIDSGEIARLKAAPISAYHLIGGQLVSMLIVSMLQCYSMYVFAWLVFDVAIWSIAGGLLVVTVATALATTAFGLLLGSICRTTQQLDSIGTIVILAMSAIGGSMVPRWIMPEFMQKMGLFTINGWSYDGFIALIRNEGLGLRGWLDDGEVFGIWLPTLVLIFWAIACAAAGSCLLRRRLGAG